MNREEVFDLIVKHTCEVIPELEEHNFVERDRLSELGANSMDRSEIVIMTLEAVQLKVPLVEVAGASDIGELAELIHEKL